MLGLTRTKTHRRAIAEQAETFAAMEASLHKVLVEKDGQLAEQDALINSTERMTVLGDLEEALNLMQAYQRVLSMMSLSDPNIIKANALLEKYGKKGDPNATYLGAQTRGESSSRDLMGRIPESYGRITPVAPQGRVLARGESSGENIEHPDDERGEFVFDPASSKTRVEQEEEYWGDEAYGSGTVRIEAVPIDEGEDKEPGYTRARIQFVDANPEPEESDDEDLVYADGTEVEKLPEED